MRERTEPRPDQPTAAGSVVDVATKSAAGAAESGMTAAQIALRSLGYTWASPNTILGLCFVPLSLASGGRVRYERGALEVHGGAAKGFLQKVGGRGCAMTLGPGLLAGGRAGPGHFPDHE